MAFCVESNEIPSVTAYVSLWAIGLITLYAGTALRARAHELPALKAVLLLLGLAPFGWLGARVHSYAFEQELPLGHLFLAPGNLLKPGYRMPGGILAAAIAAPVLAAFMRLPFLRWADLVCPLVPLALGIGRIGCLLRGCCFGTLCGLPWAIGFSNPSEAYANHDMRRLLVPGAMTSLSVHPFQLYLSLAALCVSIALLRFERQKRFDGEVAIMFVALQGLTMGALEVFRETTMFPPVPLRQAGPIAAGVLATLFLVAIRIRLYRRWHQ